MLSVTVADRVQPLAARLAAILREAPADAMEPEWIATPSAGMRAWLWLELARHLGASAPGTGDGIAANLESAFGGTLRTKVLAAGRPDDEPEWWSVDRMVWTVLAVLLESHDPERPDRGDPVGARFGNDHLGYGQARRIADLFDRYHLHRPEVVRRWAAGDDVDVTGVRLPEQHLWQPDLWRQVRERIGRPSPPEELPRILAELARGRLEVDLPDRIALFGFPVLPGGGGFIELAEAVAVHRDVNLFLLDPSPGTSATVRADAATRTRPAVRRRADDRTSDLVLNPLLRSWGRLPRESALLLADAGARSEHWNASLIESETEPEPNSLLGRLQADLRAGRAPDGSFALVPADRSVQFHATYGRSRQVDVARDAILHALADDPTLSEDEILVVCPDLASFSPLITAGFGAPARSYTTESSVGSGAPLGPPAIRYVLADRSLGRDNVVVAGLDTLLDLLPGRFDAVAVQDLVAQPAVRERYRFDDADLARIADWVEVASVRWGLDVDHRIPFGVPATVTGNTWIGALDRLLVGSAVPDDDLALSVGNVAPIGIEGEDVDLAGRLADLLDRLRTLVDAVEGSRTLASWLGLVSGAVEDLLAAPEDEEWQADRVRRVIAEIREQAAGSPGVEQVEFEFADMRRLLTERLAAVPSRPPFFRGGVTITSLESLRWVPFRVVILLGMDQPAFTLPAGDGDDLIAAVPVVGDREPRSHLRLTLLEAVLAASDRLVVIREGHDLRTNLDVPPPVVVAELLDTVAATVSGSPDPADLEIHHPRQPFDERNFLADGVVPGDGPWSHDPSARLAAEARRVRDQMRIPFMAAPLEHGDQDTFDLVELVDAVSDPVRSFVRRRLQVQIPDAAEGTPTRLPVEFSGLARWNVGDRLVSAVRRGLDPEHWLETERSRGTLPPGGLGDEKVEELLRAVEVLRAEAVRLNVADEVDTVSVDIELPDGARIVGSVATNSLAQPHGPARIGFGSMKPKYKLAAWIDLLALVATDPEASWRSVLLNIDGKSNPQVADLRPVDDIATRRRDSALSGLSRAVEVARRARCEPLPMFPTLSHAVHQAAKTGERAKDDDWRDFRGFADGYKPAASLVFADHSLTDLYEIASRHDDPFDDPSRLVGWARYVWEEFERSVLDVGAPTGEAGE
ncbi:MAG: exodeoxyribonuclease V subunit gamma [Acidimicrobiales bacterium]|nr:exodeoxyribonuclease V subunit gamma [Acidimicrobiales bacterium]